MPGGGRGTLSLIAISLNNNKHTQIANAIQMALKHNEYRIQADVTDVGAAFKNCKHTKDLETIWCYAVQNSKVDWRDYG